LTLPSQQSVRPSPVFLAVVALTVGGGALAWTAAQSTGPAGRIGVFILVIGGWLVSLCLHEFGHAYTAWRFGDADVAARGYLTLNPLKYSHPLLSLGLPLLFVAMGGIGLPGGAVYLRTGLMTPRQQTVVSLAGPFANLVMAIVLLVATRLFFSVEHTVFWAGVAFLGFLQITALVLNLLPIPGLDGYAALEPHLSPDIRRTMEPVRQFGFLILLMILLVPGPSMWFFSGVSWLFDLSGINGQLWMYGNALTRFWSAWL
jgi:Zn-dependent protease